MEYQKIKTMLDNTLSQPTKFRTENLVEINDDASGTYNINSQIKFKTSMLKSSLCDDSDTFILVNGIVTITGERETDAAKRAGERNKGVIFKNCAPFTDCKSEINNTQIDHAKNLDVVMPMYNLIECSDNYSKTSRSLWQYYRDEANANMANSESFRSEIKITGNTPNTDNKKMLK